MSDQSDETACAGVIGGARAGNPSDFRIAWVVSGGWIAARMRIGLALQRGHFSASIWNTRLIHSDQL